MLKESLPIPSGYLKESLRGRIRDKGEGIRDKGGREKESVAMAQVRRRVPGNDGY
jgi:hypothetical protein